MKHLSKIIILIVITIIISLLIYNIKENCANFFRMDLVSLLNFVFVAIISIYITRQEDRNKKIKNKLEDMLNNLSIYFSDININTLDPKNNKADVLIQIRKINNNLKFVNDLNCKLKYIDNDLKNIDTSWKKVEEIISSNIDQNNEYFIVPARYNILRKNLDDINTFIKTAILKLY